MNTVTPAQFDQACSDKVKVICSWYNKHANHAFTYDGPVDDAEYNMENALGMLDLEMPDASGRYKLRDPSQGPQLDAALKLTEVPANKKRSRGDEMLAQQARVERESMPAAATKRQRGVPTDRTGAFEGQRRGQKSEPSDYTLSRLSTACSSLQNCILFLNVSAHYHPLPWPQRPDPRPGTGCARGVLPWTCMGRASPL